MTCLTPLQDRMHSLADKQCALFFQVANLECSILSVSVVLYQQQWGCQLSSLTTSNISDSGTVWGRGFCSVLKLPQWKLAHIATSCLLFVKAYLYLMNFAAIQSKCISQIASYCIHFARSKSPRGINGLFFADWFQSNIEDILLNWSHVPRTDQHSALPAEKP